MENYLKLQQLHTYLKKSINTKLKEDTLKIKLNLANELYGSISNQIEQNKELLSESQINIISTNSSQWYQGIIKILKLKFEKFGNKHKTFKHFTVLPYAFKVGKLKTNIMPGEEALFDIKQATAIVQPYDGSAENLEAFIDSASLLKDYVSQTHLTTAIKFLRTRLTGKARIGLPANILTIDELINDVKLRCRDQKTPENLISKIKNIKHRSDTNGLCEEIDNLTMQLKCIYIQQGIPENIAQSMSIKTGVDALINNVNSETKIILKAGNFSNIKEAVQKVQENASQNSNQILSMQTQRHNNLGRNGRGNRPFRGNAISHRGGYYQRGNYQHHNNFRGRNFQRPFNYYPNRQGQNSNFRGRRDPSRRVYTLQAENSVQGVQHMIPSLPMQFPPAVIPAQPHHYVNYPQQHFFGQGQRGQQQSSQ